jgi:hypothetical protein
LRSQFVISNSDSLFNQGEPGILRSQFVTSRWTGKYDSVRENDERGH